MTLRPLNFLTIISDCVSHKIPLQRVTMLGKKAYLKISLKCTFNTILNMKRSDDSLPSMF